MYKTDEEIEELLNHKNNGLVKHKIIGSGNHGNHSSTKQPDKKRTTEEKVEVAVLANLIGVKAAAVATDNHESTVSKFSRGLGTNNRPEVELVNGIEKRLGSVSEKVVDKVDILMEIFAEEKMAELKPNELPVAIEKMVSVVEKINKINGKDGSNSSRPVVIIHAPRQQPLEQYILKEVN